MWNNKIGINMKNNITKQHLKHLNKVRGKMSRYTRGYIKLSLIAGIIMICLCCFNAYAQSTIGTPGIDPTLAKQLAEASANSSAASYVLGFVTMVSLGFAGWSIKARDEMSKAITELSVSVKTMNDIAMKKDEKTDQSMSEINTSLKNLSGKPCMLDTEYAKEILKGKLGKHEV